MKYGHGSHEVVSHEVYQSGGKEHRLLKDRAVLVIPAGGEADVSTENEELKVTLTGRGRFAVHTRRGSVKVAAEGSEDMDVEVEGNGTVIARGSLQLTARVGLVVTAHGRVRVETHDHCKLELHDACHGTVKGTTVCEAFDDSRVSAQGWSRVRLHDRAELDGKPSTSAHVEHARS